MATATKAVAIGRMPSTTPPCEASTRCIPSDISSGNSTETHSIAMTSCGHSARGGSGRRNTSSSASEHRPAIAVRSEVTAIGSIAETAMRVAGSVPPKITMPTKPSSRPRRSREEGVALMARWVSCFAGQRTAIYSVHMAAMRGSTRSNAAPHHADARDEQQAQHQVVEITVAEGAIGARANPRTEKCPGQHQQRQPEHLAGHEAAGDLQAKRGAEHDAIEDLEDATALILAPAAYAGPQDRERAGQPG